MSICTYQFHRIILEYQEGTTQIVSLFLSYGIVDPVYHVLKFVQWKNDIFFKLRFRNLRIIFFGQAKNFKLACSGCYLHSKIFTLFEGNCLTVRKRFYNFKNLPS